MQIFLNGESRELSQNGTISTLLAELDLTNKRLAVEVNLNIVPRSQFDTYQLTEGDKIEIVQAIGGG